ncbi:MAG: GDP-mannose 4,6-dehydratase [Gemmatimonadota bacterium]
MRALITGISGQDGSYLAEQLLDEGAEVHGLIRRSSSVNLSRLDPIRFVGAQGGAGEHAYDHQRLHLHYADLTEPERLWRLLDEIGPDEVYHLGAQSHVRVSFDEPGYTAAVTGLGTQHLLDAILQRAPQARVYVACSSEMFGASPPPQDETTPFRPRSPYACAKVYSYHLARHYRDRGLHVGTGILFNHESERRGETFATRKITRALGRIREGLQDRLQLGNLDARRDWGHAEDYVRAMRLIARHDEPGDFVIATGESYSVQDFLDEALLWHRDHPAAGRSLPADCVTADTPRLLRPTEVDSLCGDARKARRVLGWEPTVTFGELVARMCAHDWRLAQDEAAVLGVHHGLGGRS